MGAMSSPRSRGRTRNAPLATDAEISREISRALRHAPNDYALEMGVDGWVDVDALVRALESMGYQDVDEIRLRRVVEQASKKRHEIDGSRIRAAYGHSATFHVRLTPEEPPAFLFHGTASSSVEGILRDGLKPMRRQFVHHSDDRDTATTVAARHGGEPVLLVVEAKAAWAHGIRFQRREAHVWISDPVPAAYIQRASGSGRV